MKNIESVEYKTIENINNQYDYNQVVLSMVDSVIYVLNEAIDCNDIDNKEQLEELLNDSVLHEVIDGSQFIVYNCYHLPIIQYSDNDEYYVLGSG